MVSYSRPHILRAELAPINRSDGLQTFERMAKRVVKFQQGRELKLEQLYSACPVALSFESFQFRVPETLVPQAWWNFLPGANCTDGVVTTSFRTIHQAIATYGTEPVHIDIRRILYEILPEIFFNPGAKGSGQFQREDQPSKVPNIIFSFLVPETARFTQIMTQLRIRAVQANFRVVDSADRLIQVPVDWSQEPSFQPVFSKSPEEQHLQELWSSIQDAVQEFNKSLYHLPRQSRELSPVKSMLMSRVYAVGSLSQWTQFMTALIHHSTYYVKDFVVDLRAAIDDLHLRC